MNDRPSLAELLEVRKYFALPSTALVEKDWSVVYAMRSIAGVDATPFRLVFAGGTALARAGLRASSANANRAKENDEGP